MKSISKKRAVNPVFKKVQKLPRLPESEIAADQVASPTPSGPDVRTEVQKPDDSPQVVIE
jgi:hypothetical protein